MLRVLGIYECVGIAVAGGFKICWVTTKWECCKKRKNFCLSRNVLLRLQQLSFSCSPSQPRPAFPGSP